GTIRRRQGSQRRGSAASSHPAARDPDPRACPRASPFLSAAPMRVRGAARAHGPAGRDQTWRVRANAFPAEKARISFRSGRPRGMREASTPMILWPSPGASAGGIPMFTLSELEAAAEVVSRHMPPTPQHHWPLLSHRAGCEVFVKHENHSPIGAFKVRGGIVY